MPQTHERRQRLRPEQRRELILESAMRAFSERGFHAASISEIARGAGTTKAVVYDHFDSKRQLYDELVRRELEGGLLRIAEVPQVENDRERMRAVLDAFFSYLHERPHARRLMLETIDAEPEIGRDHRHNQAIATRAIAARLATNIPGLLADAPDREKALEMAAQMLKSTVNGLADWWFDHPEVSHDVVVDRATDFIVGGLERLGSG